MKKYVENMKKYMKNIKKYARKVGEGEFQFHNEHTRKTIENFFFILHVFPETLQPTPFAVMPPYFSFVKFLY